MWAFGSIAVTVKREMFFETNNILNGDMQHRIAQQRILKATRENVGSHSVKSPSRLEHAKLR